MSEEEKRSKPAKSKSSSSVDTSSIIFFVLMVIGIIVFIIIMMHQNSTKTYVTNFGSDIKAKIVLKNESDFTLIITANKDTVKQSGKYKKIEDKKDEYEVEFDDTKEKATFKLDTDKDDKNKEINIMVFSRDTDQGKYSITLEEQ